MGLINNLIEQRFDDISSLSNPREWLVDALTGGAQTASGVRVTPQKSLQNTAVFAAVSLLSSSVAAMPLPVYRQEGQRKEKAREHPAYSLLHDEPNPEIHAFTFRQLLMAHVCLWGNCYAEIEMNARGQPIGLWPIPPWKVEPERNDRKQLVYEVQLNSTETTTIPADQIIHVRGLGLDGLKGLSPIGMARQAVGLGLATEEFGARLFGEGANFGGVVHHQPMSPEAKSRMRKDIENKYAGLGKSHRLLFLEEGMQYERAGIPPEDAQFLQTRQFQISEIARIYNVPLHLLQEHEKSTTWGSGIEELNLGFVIFSLNAYLVNFEKEYDRKLIREADRDTYYTKHNVEGLLRGDSGARAEFYNRMFQTGSYSINEIREKEDMDPIPEGDTHFVPMNMMSVDQAAKMDAGDVRGREPEETRDTSSLTPGQVRSAQQRFRIARRWEKNFAEAAGRVIKREAANLRKNASTHLDERSMSSWKAWLERYYDDFSDFISDQMKPTLLTFAEAVQEVAAAEVDGETGLDAREKEFIDEYLETFTAGYSSSSIGQMRTVAQQAIDDGEDPIAAIEDRIDDWEEKRPEKVAMRETVQLSNAVALMTYTASGVTYKRWAAIGAETCPFCEELDGKIVEIHQEFVRSDEELEAEKEDDGTMRVYHGIGHPQLHPGCVCQVVAE